VKDRKWVKTQTEISGSLILGIKTVFNAKVIWRPLRDKKRDKRGKFLAKPLVP
jgi:hypothetical protein